MNNFEKTISKEILELSRKIFEARRLNNPRKIIEYEDPDRETTDISSEDFQGYILHTLPYPRNECSLRDYRCICRMKDLKTIFIDYVSDDTMYITVKDCFSREIYVPVTEHIISIHKSIIQEAKDEGIEFISSVICI